MCKIKPEEGKIRFSVGDRVRVKYLDEKSAKAATNHGGVGTEGIIRKLVPTNIHHNILFGYLVELKGANDTIGMRHGELEYARIRNTKIARKLNPTYKVVGDWLEVV